MTDQQTILSQCAMTRMNKTTLKDAITSNQTCRHLKSTCTENSSPKKAISSRSTVVKRKHKKEALEYIKKCILLLKYVTLFCFISYL